MSDHTYFLTISLVLGAILLVFGMKYLSAAYQARSRVKGEDAWRELAEKAVSAQSRNAATLSSMESELSTIVTRLTAVEKVLKEVE
ncbi:MAG: hypothetical protein H0X27_06175 [Caulobacteraceae bacterium]|nr:hypothetical protein [Caulobacteraceae bacterium]